MQFYKIVFNSIPELSFAHSFTTAQYNMPFTRGKNNLEITYIKEGAYARRFSDGRTIDIPAPSIASTVFDGTTFRNISNASRHTHYTFGLKGDWTVYPYTADKILACIASDFLTSTSHPLCVLLPTFTTDIKCISELSPAFDAMIHAYSGLGAFCAISCMEQVFKIFSVLTDWCIRDALHTGKGDASPSHMMYCRRAAEYMQTYIHRRITAEEIANELQISPAHLSRIFKAVTGTTLIEYNNRLKVNRAKHLMEAGTMTVRDIAAQVGIHDEKYFSRLFKKYTGKTTGAFKKSL